jgi:hypothetical protein
MWWFSNMLKLKQIDAEKRRVAARSAVDPGFFWMGDSMKLKEAFVVN